MNEPTVFGVVGIVWVSVCFLVWCASSEPPLPTGRAGRALLRIGRILVVALPILMVFSLPSAEQARADQDLTEQVWFTSDPDDIR